MCKICQKCGRIAEYSSYYGRITCTSCSWVSRPMSKEEAQKESEFSIYNIEKKTDVKIVPVKVKV